jgi:hypothetical protein
MNPPVTHFSQFSITGPDPSGARHNASASGYHKELNTSTGGELSFGVLDNSSGVNVTTPTKCVVWVVDHLQDATTKVFDMKFWLSSTTDFVGEGATYNVYFNQHMSKKWLGEIQLTDTSGTYTPESLPAGQNLYRYDGAAEITASGTDDAVSQYIYLGITIDPDTPVGVYGGAGANAFRYRVTYKYL